MDINIALTQADVECLRRHLPDGTALSEKLDQSELTYMHSTKRPAEISINCNEAEARALLRIAFEHCSEVIQKVQYAMRVAGVRFYQTSDSPMSD